MRKQYTGHDAPPYRYLPLSLTCGGQLNTSDRSPGRRFGAPEVHVALPLPCFKRRRRPVRNGGTFIAGGAKGLNWVKPTRCPSPATSPAWRSSSTSTVGSTPGVAIHRWEILRQNSSVDGALKRLNASATIAESGPLHQSGSSSVCIGDVAIDNPYQALIVTPRPPILDFK